MADAGRPAGQGRGDGRSGGRGPGKGGGRGPAPRGAGGGSRGSGPRRDDRSGPPRERSGGGSGSSGRSGDDRARTSRPDEERRRPAGSDGPRQTEGGPRRTGGGSRRTEGGSRRAEGGPPRDRPARAGRPERDAGPPRPGLERRPDEPRVPDDVEVSTLHRAVRAELRSLPKELEEIVAGHLAAAGDLIDDDPEAAYAHAEAARRRAARLPIVREAAAETAYAAGHYAAALSEFRALRRMTGVADYLPVMADCERALGRPQQALALAREAAGLDLEPALRVEMTIVTAGARADLGQQAEAVRMLRQAVSEPPPRWNGPPLGRGAAAQLAEQARQAQARLRYALADALLATGETAEARRMFQAAAERDPDQLTDARERLDELDGLTLDVGDLDDADEADTPDAEPDGPDEADTAEEEPTT